MVGVTTTAGIIIIAGAANIITAGITAAGDPFAPW
jgi:hypothetical protein